ncbi:hypothetical protein [uncultured Tenacibaculum sp.]|uniref:hypothetical protein n=1 Tax=uncultured Tenacibaculum sp. TaxID=174713 RepID=UPI0026128A20|nr:hypothetical protein [uncultured Tenacibaculum sp.]
MKVKFDQKKAKETAAFGTGAAGGFMLSKGSSGIAPAEAKTPLVRGGIALGTLLLASSIQGNGYLVKGTQGLLTGVSIEQGTSAISELIAPKVKDNPTTSGEKFLAAMGGMNAADETGYTYQPSTINLSSDAWNQDDQVKVAGGVNPFGAV